MSSSQNESRHVNNLLHTLRGEQFRHSQNLRRSRTHLTSTVDHNSPTLPIRLFTSGYEPLPIPEPADPEQTKSASKCSGPGPPKSWTLTTAKDLHDTPEWRSQALLIILSHLEKEKKLSRVPSLSLLCLRSFALACTGVEFREDVVPYILPHLRRDLIRYTAVHSPLSNAKLYLLFEPEGHADGEIIIVGPSASLRDDYFLREAGHHVQEESWDADTPSPKLLLSFMLVSTRMPASTLLTLPPTLTHLALINLPAPVSLHRLPNICPLLVVLDLSYNQWLTTPSKETLNSLDRVEWTRWSSLCILGFRECFMPDGMLQKMNRGRWDDVQVVQ
ncbi:hypothetical protein BDQ12DRAFT_676315 [Crucibulum laeve]|uniref:Uncharacterized protein n=1 Tax=Crucibulum laeve TaxID=68775 RepID=A0A5C3MBD2_9AGAR|nr:hypothetical protein BDQ12DRAFT_676315 [Crucibulum laeve]